VVCGLVARCLRLVKSEEIEIIILDPKKLEHFQYFCVFWRKIWFLEVRDQLTVELLRMIWDTKGSGMEVIWVYLTLFARLDT
jgi:hypothetical protein